MKPSEQRSHAIDTVTHIVQKHNHFVANPYDVDVALKGKFPDSEFNLLNNVGCELNFNAWWIMLKMFRCGTLFLHCIIVQCFLLKHWCFSFNVISGVLNWDDPKGILCFNTPFSWEHMTILCFGKFLTVWCVQKNVWFLWKIKQIFRNHTNLPPICQNAKYLCIAMSNKFYSV